MATMKTIRDEKGPERFERLNEIKLDQESRSQNGENKTAAKRLLQIQREAPFKPLAKKPRKDMQDEPEDAHDTSQMDKAKADRSERPIRVGAKTGRPHLSQIMVSERPNNERDMSLSRNELYKVAEATSSQAKSSRHEEPISFEAFEIGSDSDAELVKTDHCQENEMQDTELFNSELPERGTNMNHMK